MDKNKKNQWQDWRTFFKGDLVMVFGMARDELLSYIPAFVYESQTQKDIIAIYCFGLFDEWSSAYLEQTFKTESPQEWLKECENQGYSKNYVLQKMKDFKVEPWPELLIDNGQPEHQK